MEDGDHPGDHPLWGDEGELSAVSVSNVLCLLGVLVGEFDRVELGGGVAHEALEGVWGCVEREERGKEGAEDEFFELLSVRDEKGMEGEEGSACDGGLVVASRVCSLYAERAGEDSQELEHDPSDVG